MASLSELLTYTRLILFLRRQLLVTLSIKKYWNQGLTTEANRAVIELAFEKIGMNKLTALHDKDNPASGKVMEKSGMCFSHAEPYACMDQHEEGRNRDKSSLCLDQGRLFCK